MNENTDTHLSAIPTGMFHIKIKFTIVITDYLSSDHNFVTIIMPYMRL
jgi:hypothetical protein